MRKRFVVTCVAASLAAVSAQGQGISSQCTTLTTQDACQKAVDLFEFMAPQLGVAMTGGNATLGQGGTLGGLGHFVVSARANVLQGDIPQINQRPPGITGAQPDQYPIKHTLIGLPQADAAIGIFRGLPLGVTNVGGVDLLVSATYLPSFTSNNVQVSLPDGSLKLGLGARLGLIQESILLPGVSVTYLRRDLPRVNIAASINSTDSLLVNRVDVQTNAWRLVAHKNVLLFGLAAGIGQDRYSSDGAVRAVASGFSMNEVAVPPQKLTRTNYFVDASFNLPLVKLVGEIGRVSGGTVKTFNTFEGTTADAARVYGSAGIRFGF